MLNSNYYRISNTCLVMLIMVLLIEGFDYSFGWRLNVMFPEIYFFTFGRADEGWNPLIWHESGLIEILQEILLLTTISLLIILIIQLFKIKQKRNYRLLKFFIFIEILGLFYFFMEEISWGQHLLEYGTPQIFLNKESFLYNHQKEFNLHNTSNLFNEIPRTITLIWCSLSIFFIKKFKINENSALHMFTRPNFKLLFISILLLFFVIPDLVISKLDLIDYSKLHIRDGGGSIIYNFDMMLRIVFSFNFIRLSELQELIIIYYFFWHSFFLKETLNNKNNKSDLAKKKL